MKSQQAGIVLITTILLIAVLSLLVLSQMQLVFLDYKALNQLTEQHESFLQLETVAGKLISTLDWSRSERCALPSSDPNEVLQLLKNKRGCVLIHKKHEFYYLMENLGVFPCLQRNVNEINYSTQHQRISILSTTDSTVLQLRIAKLAKLERCNQNEIRLSKLGLLSWRYLT
ncbi:MULTISPECIES: hypothetical protein [Legionella]|uniref:Tfp pilus assembly protein PilX n=1 Tax=Legionella drozanskii LLAP-1 TaxID=1212489 RepID=A0A0W0SWR2_9GAMM|nr:MULTISPECIES: hypothetical protein [Legionella]KTC87810.1 hypothetical protein Ldro_1429 [Legionella drozanskii LLAP-1]PJE11187.1 MAG: hypothetical protein CK430_09085 [Legionella sp.]